jgi:lysine-N-methylase
VSIALPIIALNLREQRYSCHGCGNCCRDFTVQLREEDLAKLHEQRWESKLGEPITIEFRGVQYLRQRDDGSCIFLMDDGRCRVHAEFGFESKPIACQLFPFHLLPTTSGVQMGLNFACQSVLENKGAELRAHMKDLARQAGLTPEVAQRIPPPMLNDRLRATDDEVDAITGRIDRWLRRHDDDADDAVSLNARLDGLAWVVASLNRAKLENVRGKRFAELLDVLFGALPGELAHHPVEAPTAKQRKMLRRAVFTRIEDPKLNRMERLGRWRTTLSQLARQRRFASGRGPAPRIGMDWPDRVDLRDVERIGPARDAEQVAMIDDLMTRYLRAIVLGSRAWGAGYYGWPIVRGLQTLLLNVACMGWLARLHAAGRGESSLSIEDVRAALGRVDRTHGRAKWLGSSAERLRLIYLQLDDGLRRLTLTTALVESISGQNAGKRPTRTFGHEG